MQKDWSNRLLLNISKHIREYPSLFLLSIATLVITIMTTVASSPFPSSAYFSAGTPVPSSSPTPAESPTPTATASPSPSSEVSPSPAASPSPATSPSPAASPSPAVSPSPTVSPSPSASPSVSPNPSASPEVSPDPSTSPSPSPSSSPTVSPSPSSNNENNSNNNSSGSSGGGSGSTSPASPPECAAPTPTTVTNLRITNQGTNAVTLAWNAATPVSHYALVFTRLSDGEKYGASNIGNTTSYVINGISGQAQYTFEVFGVNDCKPGERATVTSATVAGPVLTARPSGGDGQVLGATIDLTDEAASPEPSPSPSPSPKASPRPTPTPQVLGATTEVCTQGSPWLPIIFLVAQLVLLAAIEYNYRTDKSYLRYYLTAGITLASIGFFYILGGCNCDPASWQGMICQWFWLIALVAGLATRLAGLATTKKPKK